MPWGCVAYACRNGRSEDVKLSVLHRGDAVYRTGPPLYLLESRSIHPMLFSIVYSFALEGSCHVYAKLAYRLQNGHKSCLVLQISILHNIASQAHQEVFEYHQDWSRHCRIAAAPPPSGRAKYSMCPGLTRKQEGSTQAARLCIRDTS